MSTRHAWGLGIAGALLAASGTASDGIGNLSLIATTGNPGPGALVRIALSGPPGAAYSLCLGEPGGVEVPGVGPMDLSPSGWMVAANGTLPPNGDVIFVYATPASGSLAGQELVFQAVAFDASSPSGVGISNPARVEAAPTAALAFTEVPGLVPPLPVANGMRPAVGDVDGDGDLDAYVPMLGAGAFSAAAQNVLLLNTGSGTFLDATATHLPVVLDSSMCALLADFDGDFDLDLVVGNGIASIFTQAPTTSHLYENLGAGVFSLVGDLPGGPDYVSSLAASDVDGDGDIDLVVGRDGNGSGAPERLLLNDGAGTFSDGTSGPGTGIPSFADVTARVLLADVDKDGDPDLVVANHDAGGARVHRNNGAGLFTTLVNAFPVTATAWLSDLGLADLNGDGDPDAVGIVLPAGGGTSFARVFANNGQAVFSLVSNGVIGVPSTTDMVDVALGDLDGDGDTDAVAATLTTGTDWLLLNDGTGHFASVAAGVAAPAWSRNPVPFDADGDNLLDLIYSANAANGAAHLLVR